MEIVCRLLELSPEMAATLQADAAKLPDAIASSQVYSGVYRYWHAIEFLLARHVPDAPAAHWLSLGRPVSKPSGEVPAARLLSTGEVAELDRLIREIDPEALYPHYDPEAMDAAGVYPSTYVAWEETFDPAGQIFEHFSFLQYRAKSCVEAGNALLLVFEESDS